MKRLIALAISAALSGAAVASDGTGYFVSVEGLLARCSSDTPIERGTCQGFIIGVLDAGNGVHYCLPEGKTARHFAEPLIGLLFSIPEAQRALPANEVIIYALGKAHPCAVDKPAAPATPQRNPRSGGWA